MADAPAANAASSQEVTQFVTQLLNQIQVCLMLAASYIQCFQEAFHSCMFQSWSTQGRFNKLSENIIVKVDDMGKRIDELEHSVTKLVDEASETTTSKT